MDRLLSNRGVDVWTFFAYWKPFIVGARTEVIVELDWIQLRGRLVRTRSRRQVVTGHGRATPLLWKTVASSDLSRAISGAMSTRCCAGCGRCCQAGVKVTVVADRGHADCKLFYAVTTELAFEYVIRLRGDIYVTIARCERRAAMSRGSATYYDVRGRLVGARVTDAYELPV